MANKLHELRQDAPTNGDGIVFTSNEKQIVFLLIWNATREPIECSLNGDIIQLADCGKMTKDAHRMDILNLNEGDTVVLLANEENQLKYNIII